MGLKKGFSIGFLFGLLLLVSCAAFPYRYYGIQVENWEKGKLLGEEEKDDLPLKVCKPDEASQGKCVVMMVDEFHRLRDKYIELEERLKGCEDN